MRRHTYNFDAAAEFKVEIQVEVPNGAGGYYYTDFELLRLNAFGEVDGALKYFDSASEKSAQEIFFDEKQREDFIRGSTGKKVVRWGMSDVRTPELLGQRLARFGLHASAFKRVVQ